MKVGLFVAATVTLQDDNAPSRRVATLRRISLDSGCEVAGGDGASASNGESSASR